MSDTIVMSGTITWVNSGLGKQPIYRTMTLSVKPVRMTKTRGVILRAVLEGTQAGALFRQREATVQYEAAHNQLLAKKELVRTHRSSALGEVAGCTQVCLVCHTECALGGEVCALVSRAAGARTAAEWATLGVSHAQERLSALNYYERYRDSGRRTSNIDRASVHDALRWAGAAMEWF